MEEDKTYLTNDPAVRIVAMDWLAAEDKAEEFGLKIIGILQAEGYTASPEIQ